MAANQEFKCSGNCLNCSPAQRAYCASQHAFSNMKVLDSMMNIIIDMQEGFKTLSEKIEAIQNNEATVFDPNQMHPQSATSIAQSGDGAESRSPETI